MIVLVTGGRDYNDLEKVFCVLQFVHSIIPITRLIHGKATGADTFASEWAQIADVPEFGEAADWDRYDNFAGRVRNQKMLDENNIDLVIAFPGGSGTRDMIERAELKGVKFVRIK